MEAEAQPAPSFTIFSNVAIAGWAEGFSKLLREGLGATVEVANDLHEAIDAETDVLVLNLHMRFDETLPAERVARLRDRRVIAIGFTAYWMRQQVNELELTPGVSGWDHPMVEVDSNLLGSPETKAPFRAFAESRDVSFSERNDETPTLHVGPPRLTEFKPEVDYMVTLADDKERATVMRQGSVIYAGAHAHPAEFSARYRKLMRQVALALAERPVEPLAAIALERQVHPPGTSRFHLTPAGENPDHVRTFYFRFDRPTAFTATLEHNGSNAMMLMFLGDAGKPLHATRVDSEDGEPLTIAVNIRQPAIDFLGHRYWEVGVANFDGEHSATATLTVRYDTSDTDAPLQPVAGGDGFETLSWRANALFEAARKGEKDALERFRRLVPAVVPVQADRETARAVVAREHGFNDWPTLSAHVAWELPNTLPEVLARGARMWFERGRARYPDSFSAPQLAELFDGFPEPVTSMLSDAFTQAKERGHQHFTTEHLLEVLIDDPISSHVLRSVGCDIDALRPEIGALLDALPATTFDGETQVSEPFCNATYRADFIPTLGREGMNAGSLLAGLMGEDCAAQKLLAKQGIRQQDFVNYVSHGIPTSLAEPAAPGASVLDSQLEAVVQRAFATAKASHQEFLTTEYLTAALVDESDVAATVRSMGVDVDDFARDVADHIDTTPRPDEPSEAKPTRAFNEVMQVALALAERAGRGQASPGDAFDAILRERDLPTCHLLAGAMEGGTPSRPKGHS